ncbi:MAG: sulfite dehydrogenase, partial [Microvirga sp.]
MAKDRPDNAPSRRTLLRSGLIAGAATLGGKAAAAGNPANQPPNVPDWSKYLGDGVAVRAYGRPSRHEAHVVRRDVEWLTAAKESSVSFTPLHALDGVITPNGLCFERHHAGVAE